MFRMTFDDAVLGYPELAEYMKTVRCKSVRAEWCEDLGRLSTAPDFVRDVKRWDGVPRLDGTPDPFFTGWDVDYTAGVHPMHINLYEWRPLLPERP